jgi:hypothetical protein
MNRIKYLLCAICALLVAYSSEAAITATDRGTGGNNSSEATTVIVPVSNLASGSTGILIYSGDNAAGSVTNLPSSITDSVGNTWTKRAERITSSAANGGFDLAIYCSYLTTGVTTSNNITVTYTVANATAKCWTLIEGIPGTAGNRVMYKDTGGFSSISSSTSTGTPTLTSGADFGVNTLLVGFGSAQSADTWAADADTLNGTWSTMQHNGFGSGTSGMSVISQEKIVSIDGGQTYNPTLTTAICAVGLATFLECPPFTRLIGSRTSSEASTTLTFDMSIPSGSMATLCMSLDNSGTSGTASNVPTSFTDSKSNTWTLRQNGIYAPAGINSGVELATYTSVLSSGIVNGDTITLTYTTNVVVAKCWTIFEFAGSTAYSTGGVGSGATTGTPTVTSGSIANGDYIVGVAGIEGEDSWTGDADTTNGSWSSPSKSCVNTTTTGQSLCAQYKKVTSAGTQTFNPTVTSGDTMIQWTELTVPSSVTKIPSIPSIPTTGG